MVNNLMLVSSLKNKQTKPTVMLKCQYRNAAASSPPFFSTIITACLYTERKKENVFEAFQNESSNLFPLKSDYSVSSDISKNSTSFSEKKDL